MTRTMSVTDAKAHLSELVLAAATTHDHVEITRNGELAAVLMSIDELQSLRETVSILSDAATRADIKEAEGDIAAGRLTAPDELRDVMRARREAVE